MTRIYVFDFDGTLTNFQTPDLFLERLISSRSIFRRTCMKVFTSKYFLFFMKHLFSNNRIRKNILTFLTIGINKSIIHRESVEFYYEAVRENLNMSVVQEYVKHNSNPDNLLIIASAGFENYIELFQKDFGGNIIVGNTIKCIKNISTGFLNSRDCYGIEKISRISEILSEKELFFSLDATYSDCLSDKPLFEKSKKKYFVSNGEIHEI